MYYYYEYEEYRGEDNEMSFELWLGQREQWTMHRLSIPRDATQQVLLEKIAGYVTSLYYDRSRLWKLRGTTWYRAFLEDLKEYPSVVIWPEYGGDMVETSPGAWNEVGRLREDDVDE
jgi:hypothetical protein